MSFCAVRPDETWIRNVVDSEAIGAVDRMDGTGSSIFFAAVTLQSEETEWSDGDETASRDGGEVDDNDDDVSDFATR